jgi:hypothetical protein
MKVKELIELLKKYNYDSELAVETSNDCSIVASFDVDEIGWHIETETVMIYLL